MKGFKCSLLLIFIPLLLYAGEWKKVFELDRFGDETTNLRIFQTTFGKATNSLGKSSTQAVALGYLIRENAVVVMVKGIDALELPPHVLFMGYEAVKLYIKDSMGRIYTFNGFEVKDSVVMFEASNDILSLLRKNEFYKAVVEGKNDSWSCTFSFDGNMPD
jgi:hypothetical protein